MTGREKLLTFALVTVALVTSVSADGGQTTGPNEDLARRGYENGLRFMQSQKYAEGLKDLKDVVETYPTSSVAGDALIEMATYYLEIAKDPVAAQTNTDLVLKTYRQTEAGAVAFVLNGRIALEKGRTPAEVDAALATFERVPGLYPGSVAIASSLYYSGEALRLVRRYEDAAQKYRDTALRYPGSEWARKALIGLAVCLTQTGQATTAMEKLQHVRIDFAGSSDAATALKWNTILYRLYVRPPAQPPYAFSGQTVGAANKFKDVAALAIDGKDNMVVAHKTALAVLDPKGALVRSVPAEDPSALFIAPNGVPVHVRTNSLYPEGGKPVALAAPQSNGQLKPIEEIPAALATSRGEWLVADRRGKAILTFAETGKFLKAFANGIVATRLAESELGDVAAIDRESSSVTLFDPSGKVVSKIAVRGTGWDMPEPVDVAFDVLGHLYVLDKAKGVFVFSPQGKFLASFSIPERSPGSFTRAIALGIDSAARLYIFDERAQAIQVYQ